MSRTLDVSRLPQSRRVGQINLASTVQVMQPAVESWMTSRIIRQTPSFGFAMANPDRDPAKWDDPEDLTWFVAGWGPDRARYIANAVRKLRPAAREGDDTLTLAHHEQGRFREVVDSQESDGTFAWGDFPYGGAVYVTAMGHELLGAVSGLAQEEDHAVTAMILDLIGLQLYKVKHSRD